MYWFCAGGYFGGPITRSGMSHLHDTTVAAPAVQRHVLQLNADTPFLVTLAL